MTSTATALRELVDLALERGEPLLELLEPADALLQLVDAVAHRVHRAEQPLGAGHVAQPLHRVLAQVGEPAEQIGSPRSGHGRNIPSGDRLDTWSSGRSRSRAARFLGSRRGGRRRRAARSPAPRSRPLHSPAEAGALRHRPRRRRDDGEPLVRPLPRLAPRRRRQAGGPDATPTPTASPHPTFPLAPDFQGCSYHDPDHSYDGARVEWNNGACDGWLRAGRTTSSRSATTASTTCRSSARPRPRSRPATASSRRSSAPTFPNRFYSLVRRHRPARQHASRASTCRRSSTGSRRSGCRAALLLRQLQLPAALTRSYNADHAQVREVLQAAARRASCPRSRTSTRTTRSPTTGPRRATRATTTTRTPTSAPASTSCRQIYNAVTQSPAWPRTLLIFTFDEWGGFFDHVPPPAAPDVSPSTQQRGFRIPCLLVSPFARRGHVAHGVYDHTSILKLVEWRWGLEPLSVRDARGGEPRRRRSTSRTATSRLRASPRRASSSARPAPRRDRSAKHHPSRHFQPADVVLHWRER